MDDDTSLGLPDLQVGLEFLYLMRLVSRRARPVPSFLSRVSNDPLRVAGFDVPPCGRIRTDTLPPEDMDCTNTPALYGHTGNLLIVRT